MSTTPTTAREADKGVYEEALSKARSKALATLRENHRDEFNALITGEMKAHGFQWKPRPTKAEKAEEALRKLLAENPELQAKVQVVDQASVSA